MNLVFIHGLAGSKNIFNKIGPILQKQLGAKTLSFDLLGFGAEKNTPSDYSLGSQLTHVLKKIEQKFGQEKIILVGHSLGGVIASALAKQATARTEKLILLNMPVYHTRQEFIANLANKDAELGWAKMIVVYPRLSHLSCNVLCRFGLMNLFYPLKPKYIDNQVFFDYSKHTWTSLKLTLEKILLGHPSLALVQSLQLPILNIQATKDNLLLSKDIPQSNVTNLWIEGGHILPQQKPKMVAEAIINFLKQK